MKGFHMTLLCNAMLDLFVHSTTRTHTSAMSAFGETAKHVLAQ